MRAVNEEELDSEFPILFHFSQDAFSIHLFCLILKHKDESQIISKKDLRKMSGSQTKRLSLCCVQK